MTGQTGTGKELVARALHQLGPRRAKKLLTEAAEERLIRWSWPGNVRELRNAIERSCLLCEGHLLTEGDLARSLTDRRIAVGPVVDEEPPGPPPTADEVHAAMDSTGGNKSLAARRLPPLSVSVDRQVRARSADVLISASLLVDRVMRSYFEMLVV